MVIQVCKKPIANSINNKQNVRKIKKKKFLFLDSKHLLVQSERLHRYALELSLDAFGEINVQTAKHYGNLGRLYQSMTKYWVSCSAVLTNCLFSNCHLSHTGSRMYA